MNELIGIVLGLLIGVSTIVSLHLSENRSISVSDSKKIMSGGLIYGEKNINQQSK
ncbi:hypothetical protein ACWOFR_03125 [Carnobacterium gallinarum]|uniref:hypothetical protein n=1 Tax=Carnobacterium gallinarum TaxID=2749 RepID=UPI000B06C495|nr:hypothetical protein [Carnobacterium gallinarum]